MSVVVGILYRLVLGGDGDGAGFHQRVAGELVGGGAETDSDADLHDMAAYIAKLPGSFVVKK